MCGAGTVQAGNACEADLDAICGQGTRAQGFMCVLSLAVGGAFVGVEKSALFLAAAQLSAAWMIPVIVSGIGIAVVIARKF